MKKIRIFVLMVAAIAIAMYIFNPFGVPTLDARARIFGATPFKVSSMAMAPTLQADELILVSTASYMNDDPAINDIVVFKVPFDKNVKYVMRVIARGGETIVMADGKVYVDGKEIDQSYLDPNNMSRTRRRGFGPLRVAPGHLFVLGDNRDHSNDSRYWGLVPRANVLGKVTMIWYSDDTDRIGGVR